MQFETQEYETGTFQTSNRKREESHFSMSYSKEDLKVLEQSISEDIKKFPAFHLFSTTFLQFLSTVCFLRFIIVICH